MKISALLLTHNEARHIADCLNSLAAVPKIVVVDSGSTDGTLEILRRSAKPITLVQRPFVSFSDQRNYALDQCFEPGEWALHLDADERMTEALAQEIARLKDDPPTPAYNIASLTYLRGKAIPRASGYPVYQTRLSRVGDFHFVEVGHGQKAPPEMKAIPQLKQPYEHHPFDNGLSEWILRHDRYSSREAEDWIQNTERYGWRAALREPIARRQWLKQLSRRMPFAPTWVYLYLLLGKGGILEGVEGRDYCRMRMIYEHLISLKVHEREAALRSQR